MEQTIWTRFNPDEILLNKVKIEVKTHPQSWRENQWGVGMTERFFDSGYVFLLKLFHLTEIRNGGGQSGFRVIETLIPAVDIDRASLRHGADEGGVLFEKRIFRIVEKAVGQKIVQIGDDPIPAKCDGDDD